MRFAGIQKLTLLDFPQHTACTVFTQGCSFRCPFCQNSALLPADTGPDGPGSLNEEELFNLLERRRGLLDGVCVTGGEPTLQKGLPDLLRRIKALGFLVKLDTNGARPDILQALAAEGLIDYVAMDIKNAPERYAETAGTTDAVLEPVRRSAAFLMAGAIPFEFRTTVVRELHTDADMTAIADWLAGGERFYLQSFVPSDGVLKPGLSAWDKETMLRFRNIMRKRIPLTELRGV